MPWCCIWQIQRGSERCAFLLIKYENFMKIKAVVSDAYGTLFDVCSIQVLAEEFYPSKRAHIAVKWRDKQI
jgi:hypothetical protein